MPCSVGDGSIGILSDANPVIATAGFTNRSATMLTALQVSFTAVRVRPVAMPWGDPNSGQSFVNQVLPPQGIAIDSLSVILPDGDRTDLRGGEQPRSFDLERRQDLCRNGQPACGGHSRGPGGKSAILSDSRGAALVIVRFQSDHQRFVRFV
jgi:hypothetical protein